MISYRTLRRGEEDFLREMFYDALYVREGQDPYPLTVIDLPELAKYTINWGKQPGDVAIVAEYKGEPIGAIWGRIFRVPDIGYGFVDEQTPEISMAVKASYRGQGIGGQLIEHIINHYKTMGVKALSLSVDKENKAKHLYERKGFSFHSNEGTAITMQNVI